MTKSLHPLYWTLRNWAAMIERNLLKPEEAKKIAEVFRRVAAGEEFDEVLGVKRMANRPQKWKTQYYVEQVYLLNKPMRTYRDEKEPEGISVNEAIDTVARASAVSFGTVKAAYYSKKGKEIRKLIEAELKSPLD